MTIVENPERFEIGRVVSRTFAVLTKNAGVFLGLSAILMAPMLLLNFYLTRQPAFSAVAASGKATADTLGSIYANSALSYLVLIACTYLLQAAVIQGTIATLNEEPVRLGDSLSVSFRSFLPILAIALLSLIGMTVGFVLLVIPGIILALAWSVVIPVQVVENAGVAESFGRSRALTSGHRWKILGLVLLYFVLAIAATLVINPLMGVSFLKPGAAALGAPYLIVSWIERAVLSAIVAVGTASLYYELKLVKEGMGARQLAAAFD